MVELHKIKTRFVCRIHFNHHFYKIVQEEIQKPLFDKAAVIGTINWKNVKLFAVFINLRRFNY